MAHGSPAISFPKLLPGLDLANLRRRGASHVKLASAAKTREMAKRERRKKSSLRNQSRCRLKPRQSVEHHIVVFQNHLVKPRERLLTILLRRTKAKPCKNKARIQEVP